MRLRSCLMMVSMSFCLSLSVFLNWAKTLFFLLVSFILEMGCGWVSKNKQGGKKSQSEIKKKILKKSIRDKKGSIFTGLFISCNQENTSLRACSEQAHIPAKVAYLRRKKPSLSHMYLGMYFFLYSLAEHWSVTDLQEDRGPSRPD